MSPDKRACVDLNIVLFSCGPKPFCFYYGLFKLPKLIDLNRPLREYSFDSEPAPHRLHEGLKGA
jgi:hypothetical protein